MSNTTNDVGLALLAVLEAQAKKTGRKSVVKAVVRRLRDGGTDETLLAEVAAIGAKKAKAPKPPKADAKAISEPKVKAKRAKKVKDAAKSKVVVDGAGNAKAEPKAASLHA